MNMKKTVFGQSFFVSAFILVVGIIIAKKILFLKIDPEEIPDGSEKYLTTTVAYERAGCIV